METLIFLIVVVWVLVQIGRNSSVSRHKPPPSKSAAEREFEAKLDKLAAQDEQRAAQAHTQGLNKAPAPQPASPPFTGRMSFGRPLNETKSSAKAQPRQPPEQPPTAAPNLDPLSKMGFDYEQMIGEQLLAQGYFVIHSGLIDGRADGGVDLIAIDRQRREIHLVQCKNWHKRPLTLERLEELYQKLCHYSVDLSRFTHSQLASTELASMSDDTLPWLAEVQQTLSSWQQRKVLYIASEKVVDLTIGQHLYMHGPHIFRYKDLKMVTYLPEQC